MALCYMSRTTYQRKAILLGFLNQKTKNQQKINKKSTKNQIIIFCQAKLERFPKGGNLGMSLLGGESTMSVLISLPPNRG
jgi:hypothetical protein